MFLLLVVKQNKKRIGYEKIIAIIISYIKSRIIYMHQQMKKKKKIKILMKLYITGHAHLLKFFNLPIKNIIK